MGLSLGLKESPSSSAWPLRPPTLGSFFWSSLGLVVYCYDTWIRLGGGVSRIRYVSDTDTPWIRPGYVLSHIQKNRIRIALDMSIRHAWGVYLREKPEGGGRK